MRETVLSKISGFVGLDLRYLLTNGFWVSLKYGITAVSGLVLSVGFARLAPKELFGQYQFILSFLGLLSVLSLPGFNMVVLRSVALGRGGFILRRVTLLSFLSSWLIAFVVGGYIAYRHFFHEGLSIEIEKALLFAALLAPFFYAPNAWYTLYEGRSEFRQVALRTIVASLIVMSALISGLFFRIGLPGLVFLYFGTNALITGFFYWGSLRRERLLASRATGEFSLDARYGDMRYGLAVTAQKFVYGLAENVPPIVISFLFGFGFLALFQVGYFFINAFAGGVSALLSLYLPKLFRNEGLMHRRIVWQNIVFGVVSFLGLLTLLRFLFPLLYGEAYSESCRIAWGLSPLLVFIPLRTYLVNYFTALGMNSFVISAYVVANVSGFFLFILLRDETSILAASTYVYAITLVLIAILLPRYFFNASRKTDSI